MTTRKAAAPVKRAPRTVPRLIICATLALLVSACEVTNPGPVQDEFLNDLSSHAGMINGARRQLLLGFNNVAFMMAFPAHEIFPGGNTGAYGFNLRILFGGEMPYDVSGGEWSQVQQARYIAEDAIRRFVDENAIAAAQRPTSTILAEAYLWAGFANRVLGEFSCDAVFDGGPLEPASKHLERAQTHFSNALTIANAANKADLKNAALGGRAQVRMALGDWTGAAADAKLVPTSYVWLLPADDAAPDTRNTLFFANAGNPYRSYSVWKTFFHTYYPETGDPRAKFVSVPGFPFANGSMPGVGQVPFLDQTKYTKPGQGFPMVRGQEMRLIEAEALLVAGDWQGAMTIINALHTSYSNDKTGQKLAPLAATNLVDGWTNLKRERGIELWLEGRRLPDMRRWKEKGTPGALDWPNWNAQYPRFGAQPALCRVIPLAERAANPNIPDVP
jgi:starch-binding outer membrane protein, SusD/RagB family